jgi:hypothetical protein
MLAAIFFICSMPLASAAFNQSRSHALALFKSDITHSGLLEKIKQTAV